MLNCSAKLVRKKLGWCKFWFSFGRAPIAPSGRVACPSVRIMTTGRRQTLFWRSWAGTWLTSFLEIRNRRERISDWYGVNVKVVKSIFDTKFGTQTKQNWIKCTKAVILIKIETVNERAVRFRAIFSTPVMLRGLRRNGFTISSRWSNEFAIVTNTSSLVE